MGFSHEELLEELGGLLAPDFVFAGLLDVPAAEALAPTASLMPQGVDGIGQGGNDGSISDGAERED